MTRISIINRTSRGILILFGIWPGIPYVAICRIYWLIALSTDELCMYRYFLMHLHINDLSVLMDCLSSMLAYGKFIAKLIVFWLNQRKLIEILTMMIKDWDDCSNCDTEMHEAKNKMKLSNRITTAIFILHTMAVLGYSIGILLIDVDVNDRESELPLFLRMQLPIDIHTKRRYTLLLTVQFVQLVMVSYGNGLLNSLLLTLILHVGGQVNILRFRLTELAHKDNKRMREPIIIMMNKIIQKHQKIINFSEHIENLYTYIALVHFVLNTVMICSLGFLIVTAIGTPNATETIVRTLLFYTITNVEAFIFCFAGEYLKNKSSAIGSTAYNSAWYKLRPEESRTLLFVMLRAQKQLTLTAGKMMDLSLESFTNIIKASGSYLSVLLAMQ